MTYPRLGTPAGDRAVASAQRSYDNMTPEDVYGPDEPEEETAQSCPKCGDDMQWIDAEWRCECEDDEPDGDK
jgi:hypothetical protein